METKELKIATPEGYEIDRENSTFECIKFKPKGVLTYEDVAEALFRDKTFYILDYGDLISNCSGSSSLYTTDSTAATSEKQLEKLLAINKLMNVAKYLNGDWKPDWNVAEEDKFYITIYKDCISVECVFLSHCIETYFKTEELAQQAIDILGEDTIRLALSTDW